jgi:fluoroacetyl-CoA thioesterase
VTKRREKQAAAGKGRKGREDEADAQARTDPSARLPENKTVPYTYPESPEIASMPKVFATGEEVVSSRVVFKVRAHDGVDLIGDGRHERFVVTWDKFNAKVAAKAAKVAQAV